LHLIEDRGVHHQLLHLLAKTSFLIANKQARNDIMRVAVKLFPLCDSSIVRACDEFVFACSDQDPIDQLSSVHDPDSDGQNQIDQDHSKILAWI
jgi:hypothetical protein